MAVKTVRTSDLSGVEIPETDKATIIQVQVMNTRGEVVETRRFDCLPDEAPEFISGVSESVELSRKAVQQIDKMLSAQTDRFLSGSGSAPVHSGLFVQLASNGKTCKH